MRQTERDRETREKLIEEKLDGIRLMMGEGWTNRTEGWMDMIDGWTGVMD